MMKIAVANRAFDLDVDNEELDEVEVADGLLTTPTMCSKSSARAPTAISDRVSELADILLELTLICGFCFVRFFTLSKTGGRAHAGEKVENLTRWRRFHRRWRRFHRRCKIPLAGI
jgi:hypothetical protein